jgi:hypothetical protein
MAFRLIVSETADLTTIEVVGRLGDDAVVILGEACSGAGRPLVLDLSELTSASESGTLLLRRLASEGVHLLGSSSYMRLLLDLPPMTARPRIARRGLRSRTPSRTDRRGAGPS